MQSYEVRGIMCRDMEYLIILCNRSFRKRLHAFNFGHACVPVSYFSLCQSGSSSRVVTGLSDWHKIALRISRIQVRVHACGSAARRSSLR